MVGEQARIGLPHNSSASLACALLKDVPLMAAISATEVHPLSGAHLGCEPP